MTQEYRRLPDGWPYREGLYFARRSKGNGARSVYHLLDDAGLVSDVAICGRDHMSGSPTWGQNNYRKTYKLCVDCGREAVRRFISKHTDETESEE